MAIARVQSPAGGTSNASFAITLTSTAAGEAIFGMMFCSGAAINSCTVTDNKSNTYARDASGTSSEGVGIWSCLNPTPAVTSVTFTSSGGSFIIGFAATYTGLLTAAGFDKTNYLANGAGATYTSNATPTLSQASELCLGMTGTGQSSSNNIAASGSWTNPAAHLGNAGDGDDARWQEQIVSSTTALAATGTHTSVTRFHAIIATYKAAAASFVPDEDFWNPGIMAASDNPVSVW